MPNNFQTETAKAVFKPLWFDLAFDHWRLKFAALQRGYFGV